ncbi:MAG TPA: hypothetical protein VFO85_21200 [Vicinamibacteria bacterium]|nr:hypothetical protein [Vicinamibacteria bacterium]
MARNTSKTWSALAALAVTAALLPSCGGGGGGNPNGPGPNPTPTPSNAVRTVLLSGVPFVLNPGTAMFRNVDDVPAGTLDIAVNWPGSGDINLYVTPNSCANFADVQAGRCQVMAKSDGTAKPETVNFATTGVRTYTVWIYNNGGSRETGSFDVGITTSGPIATPTPTTNDPRTGLAPGPVSRVVLYIYQIRQADGTYRDKFQDSQGRWILHPGEFVVFDSTQLNANGDKCQWVRDPQYSLDDPQRVLNVRGSSQPFLFRVDVVRPGELTLVSSIDGVDSAPLRAISE